MRALASILVLCACGTTTAPPTEAGADASSDATSDASSDAPDVVIPPCHEADAALPPDASPSELAGAGQCCTASSECVLNTAICVSGRCCIAIKDSGRRCHANSDCCSLQCSCGDSCSQDSSGGGTCTPYP